MTLMSGVTSPGEGKAGALAPSGREYYVNFYWDGPVVGNTVPGSTLSWALKDD